MIHLGGRTETPQQGYWAAAGALADGTALKIFLKMVEAQGGDLRVFDDLKASHKPGATLVLNAWESGYVAEMDTMELGWAVQRLGAGREKAGESVDPYAGIEFHARRGDYVETGKPFATLYACQRGQAAGGAKGAHYASGRAFRRASRSSSSGQPHLCARRCRSLSEKRNLQRLASKPPDSRLFPGSPVSLLVSKTMKCT